MPDIVHWYLDDRKNTARVRRVDGDMEVFTISVDVPGQRANTCTVPRAWFREVADQIDPPDPPAAA